MRKAYSGQDIALTLHLQQLLEAQGIGCVVRNAFLAGGAGEIPVNETWPELWVLADEDYARARALVLEATAEPTTSYPSWTCPRCGERVDGEFSRCWNCGAPHPGLDAEGS